MGITVVPRKSKKKKSKIRNVFLSSPMGFTSYNSMSNEDADILIQAKAIKSDSVRYENAKQAMKLRGY